MTGALDINRKINRQLRLCIRALSIAILGLNLLSALVPFNPSLPGTGLDPSWIQGIGIASSQHMAFGSAIVSPFGPYAALFTHAYDPLPDAFTIGIALVLAVLYLLVALAAFRDDKGIGYLLAAAFFALAAMDRNILFFALPILLALAIYRLTAVEERIAIVPSSPWQLNIVVIAGGMGSGLLCLSKGSMIPYSWLMLVLCAGWLAYRRQVLPATLLLIAHAIAISLFWVIAGQSLIDLAAYFASTLEIISGYTDAMSSQGAQLEWMGYLAISLLTLLLLWVEHAGANRIFLGLVAGAFYFFSFKAGFTRHDGPEFDGTTLLLPGHVGTAAFAVLLMGICAPAFFVSPARRLIAGLLGLLGCTLLIAGYGPANPAAAARQILATQTSALEGVRTRLGMGTIARSPDARYLRHNALARTRLDIDGSKGSWDLYSYDQAFLLAHNVQWKPRPAFQSYFAYTPHLLLANANHLQGRDAPDNIVFKVQTIDQRYPTLDDGLSWPYLMGLYAPGKYLDDDFLLLERRQANDPQRQVALPTYSPARTIRLGQRVELPTGADLRYARLDFSKTLVGKAMSLAYKAPILKIRVELANGRKVTYRLIPGITKAGFLISPRINSADQFALAATGQLEELHAFQVVAFTLLTNENGSLAWHDEVEFSLSVPR